MDRKHCISLHMLDLGMGWGKAGDRGETEETVNLRVPFFCVVAFCFVIFLTKNYLLIAAVLHYTLGSERVIKHPPLLNISPEKSTLSKQSK